MLLGFLGFNDATAKIKSCITLLLSLTYTIMYIEKVNYFLRIIQNISDELISMLSVPLSPKKVYKSLTIYDLWKRLAKKLLHQLCLNCPKTCY